MAANLEFAWLVCGVVSRRPLAGNGCWKLNSALEAGQILNTPRSVKLRYGNSASAERSRLRARTPLLQPGRVAEKLRQRECQKRGFAPWTREPNASSSL